MKINLVSLTMFVGGVLLVYSGVKDYDPRDVIKWALSSGKTKLETMHQKKKAAETPKVNPKDTPGDLGLEDPDRKDDVPA